MKTTNKYFCYNKHITKIVDKRFVAIARYEIKGAQRH